jgi:hypothetical protein
VIGPRRRNRLAGETTVRDQHFPLVTGRLQSVEVKGDQVVEKVAFHLAAVYVNLGP